MTCTYSTLRPPPPASPGLTNEELLRGARTAWDQGWRQLKLYFMIGLPGESDADVLGIAETIEWLQRECSDGRRHMAINVTISNFTPKVGVPGGGWWWWVGGHQLIINQSRPSA